MATFNGRNIVAMPSYPAPQNVTWKALDLVAAAYSPFTGQAQYQDWQASYLEASLQMPNLKPARLQGVGNAQQWIAFLMACRGPTNVFQFGDPRFTAPQTGVGPGSLQVAGSNQTGYLLSVTGYSGTLTAGDCIQIGYRMYRVTATTQLSGGAGTLSIWPNIRESPPSGTSIQLTNCQGIWCLKNPMREFSLTLQGVYGMTFDIREAI